MVRQGNATAWPRMSTWRVGRGIAEPVVTSLASKRRLLLVTDRQTVAELPSALARMPRLEVAGSATPVSVRAAAETMVRDRPDLLVAIGASASIDTTRLAALAVPDPGLLEWVLDRAEARAVVRLPGESKTRGLPILAMPTGIGTAAESNEVATLTNGRGHRLVVGPRLRPDAAMLDADLLRADEPRRIVEECLDSLLRVAGASTSPHSYGRARSDAITLGRALLATDPASLASAEARLRVARLSAATHRSHALRLRDPFAPKHWYIANELCFAAALRRTAAAAVVVPAVWRCAADGDTRFGDPARLHSYWRSVTADLDLPQDPAEGVSALIARWGVELAGHPGEAVLDGVARRVEAEWVIGEPALRDIDARDLRALLDTVRWGSATTAT